MIRKIMWPKGPADQSFVPVNLPQTAPTPTTVVKADSSREHVTTPLFYRDGMIALGLIATIAFAIVGVILLLGQNVTLAMR